MFIPEHLQYKEIIIFEFTSVCEPERWRFSQSLWLQNLEVLFSDPSKTGIGRKCSESSASVYCHSGSITTSTNQNYIFTDIFKSKNFCIFACFVLSSWLMQITFWSSRIKKHSWSFSQIKYILAVFNYTDHLNQFCTRILHQPIASIFTSHVLHIHLMQYPLFFT